MAYPGPQIAVEKGTMARRRTTAVIMMLRNSAGENIQSDNDSNGWIVIVIGIYRVLTLYWEEINQPIKTNEGNFEIYL